MAQNEQEVSVIREFAEKVKPGELIGTEMLAIKGSVFIARRIGIDLADGKVDYAVQTELEKAVVRFNGDQGLKEFGVTEGIDERSFLLGAFLALDDVCAAYLQTKHPDIFRPQY